MDVPSLLSERQDRRSQRLPPKTVAFELLLDEGSKTRARIPLRILVNQHDDTESIVTTVKNFYGIYDGHGVSFEDLSGNILTARYENLADHSLVYVRTVAGPEQVAGLSDAAPWPSTLEPHRKTSLGEPFEMAPPLFHDHLHSPPRPSSRLARKRSSSPIHGRGRRSASHQQSGSVPVSRGSSANGSYHDDGGHDYSDSDAGRSSLTGSKRARSEQFASADISLDNVVQEGRRVRSLFDSSVGSPLTLIFLSLTLPAGVASLRTTSGASDCLNLVTVSTKTNAATRGTFHLPYEFECPYLQPTSSSLSAKQHVQ